MSEAVERGRIAAFFDLDGTLLPLPSLERRFVKWLIARRAIPRRNYFSWLANAVKLASCGAEMMRHGNKMYLRGVSANGLTCEIRGRADGEMPVPHFFRAGVEKMAWYAAEGHAIFLVTGTVEPLAREIALALTMRLALRGLAARVGVCATRLEERNGRWTGRILGEAIFGEAKKSAVERIALENGFALQECFAYADHWADRWMLEAVGRPAAVNPSQELHRLARERAWPILWWRDRSETPQREVSAQRREQQIWENPG